MDNFFIYYDKVLVIQDSFSNDIVRHAKGYFNVINDEIIVDLIEDSPFIDFQFSKSRFIAQVEIKDPDQYRIFDLLINPIDSKLGLAHTRFKVEINEDFTTFKSLIEKKNLEEELSNELKHNVIKQPKVKL